MERWLVCGLAAVVAMGLLGAGCANPCDAYCDGTLTKIEDLSCLDVWGTTWEDQGFADDEDYRTRCVETYDQREADAWAESPEVREDLRQGCSDALDELEGVEDCSGVLLHEL